MTQSRWQAVHRYMQIYHFRRGAWVYILLLQGKRTDIKPIPWQVLRNDWLYCIYSSSIYIYYFGKVLMKSNHCYFNIELSSILVSTFLFLLYCLACILAKFMFTYDSITTLFVAAYFMFVSYIEWEMKGKASLSYSHR